MRQQLLDRRLGTVRASPGRARWLAGTLLGLTIVLLALSLVIGFTGGETWNVVFAFTPVAIAFAVVGALVAARTGNNLGWLLLGTGVGAAVALVTRAYAVRVPAAELPAAGWVGWIFTVVLWITAPLLVLPLLLFPDGRLPSPRWRPVVWVVIIDWLALMVCPALSNVNFSSNFPRLRDPVMLVAPLGTAYNLAEVVWTLVFLVGAAAMIVRFRRSGHEQRLQLKWFMYASAVAAVIVLAASQFGGNDPLAAFEIAFTLIPAAVGIAILKYRLYDIDRLISRTLAYAIVTGLLIGVYAGLVLLATQVFGLHTPVAVAAATLAAAALFNPLRRRVQHVVDRRFNRVRYDADQTVAAFAARLRDAVDLDTVRTDLVAVVNRAVEPAHISVWIVGGGPGHARDT
jgi:tryptophan-rich sensory protein